MPTFKTKEYESALSKKGFKLDNTHHSMYWYYLDGKKTSLRTRTSHSASELNDYLQNECRKQLGGLSKQQLSDFIECPFTAEQYQAFLLEKGRVIRPSPAV